MEKSVYQMFILGTGVNIYNALSKGLGGVIYFTHDIKDRNQFKNLISEHISKAIIPPFLSIDQEGGRVERTEKIHTRYLSPRFAFEKGTEYLKEQTNSIAKELKDYGINLNFAPCVDVNTNPNNPIIGERAFSNKTCDVISGMSIVSEIYKQNGIIPCIKHYPGHGDANKDSHLTLPEIDLDFETMKQNHIEPFRIAVKNGADMIMAAHLHCTCFDKDTIPASLSKNAIGYLRNIIGYNGVIISDDMVMKGVQNFGDVEAVLMGINAGLDMFIYRGADDKTIEIIEQIVNLAKKDKNLKEKIIKSNNRIKNLKQKFLIT